MGWALYRLPDGRPGGYAVSALCCFEQIDRGLGWLCGDTPHDGDPQERGCGGYYCTEHQYDHDCPHPDEDEPLACWEKQLVTGPGDVFLCALPTGHDGPCQPDNGPPRTDHPTR